MTAHDFAEPTLQLRDDPPPAAANTSATPPPDTGSEPIDQNSPPGPAPADPAIPDDACHKARGIKVPLRPGIWPTPDMSLLHEGRQDLPDFPLDVLPPFWGQWVPTTARGACASTDHVALSLLSAAASLIGSARRVAPSPVWSEPCVLWTALVGPASSGKTPAMNTALRLLRALDTALAVAHTTAVHQYNADFAAAQYRWPSAVLAARRSDRTPPAKPVYDAPRRRQLLASDARLDAMADVLRGTPRGMLLACDTGGGWLDDIARAAADIQAFWQSAWSGADWTLRHNGEATAHIANPAVSILGTLRPDQITPALVDSHDLTSRFLFTWPEPPPFQPLAAVPQTINDAALQALARLRDLPDVPREVPLAAAALTSFDDFRHQHHAEAGNLSGWDAAWWGKGASVVLRLAGVLDFLDWAARPAVTAEPAQVSAWSIQCAADLWWGYLWPHARAVGGRDGGNDHRQDARRMLRWLRHEQLLAVSPETLRRKALGGSRKAAQTERTALALVASGWLRQVKTKPDGVGRPAVRWIVNPAIRTRDDDTGLPRAEALSAIPATPDDEPAQKASKRRT
ncbi:DUF3987 domain-containing protein [Reyranella sp. CPCC 100927]|uniref:DUF3987 domain-containing protein n=1 Tax=Reyranella sp. CPCC 100927 TaxID=2599616 RepID=UPI0011B4EC96|nr:DUF3987 domain-containing protein [Reyranella sp. CPCC 100927]TWT05959.1 DUF3987 domain-containing protein [Reyranella sp. CPCC 100927]